MWFLPSPNDAATTAQAKALDARLARLERKLDAVMAFMNIAVPDSTPLDDAMPEIRRLKATGAAIQAIKLYREQTGASLAEAKRAVEEMA